MIEIEDEGDDQFLSLVEAAEAEAIASARVIKRPKLPVVDSGNETGQEDDQEQEGSYTAALRGSRSALWKLQQKQLGNLHDKGGGNIAVPSSTMAAGACFKCGMTGHWARDCGGQGSSVDRADRLPAAKPCPCGSGTCLVLTSNTAKNPGRMFYRCPLKAENGGCNFFEWCDTPSSECDSGTVIDGQSNARVPVLHCPCGAGSCLVLVSKSGKNEGQRYYKCPANGGRGSCGFFKWCNEQQGSIPRQFQPSFSISAAQSPLDNNKGVFSCFKCGQEGHWAKDCLNLPSNSCFKCGKSGHWAKDCTSPVSAAPAGTKSEI